MGYGFSFHMEDCIGCQACVVACAKKNKFFYGFRKLDKHERDVHGENAVLYLSTSCHHCENPECMRMCPEQLYYKRRDGVVMQKIGQCKGCLTCVKSCPYGAPKFNHRIGKVNKCNLCVDENNGSFQPKCVAACPTNALRLIKSEQFEQDSKLQEFDLGNIGKSYLTQPSFQVTMSDKMRKKYE